MVKRKYKQSKCRNGWKTCGFSSRCYPPDTICGSEKKNESNARRTKKSREEHSPGNKRDAKRTRKRNKKNVSASERLSIQRVKKHEKRIAWKTIAAGAVAVTVAGASLGYVMTRKKEIIPKPMDFESSPIPKGMQKYNPNDRNIFENDAGNARDNVDSMFDRTGSVRTRQETGKIGDPTQSIVANKYDKNVMRESQLAIKKENRMKAQQWAHEVLSDPDTIILDLETTGLMKGVDPYAPETWKRQRGNVPGIAQIGMVDTSLNSVDISMNPEKKISKEAEAVIGRSQKEFNDLPTFKDYYPALKKRLTGKRVIAFNARFDLQVLDALCIENDLPLIDYKNRPKFPKTSKGKYKWNLPNVMDNQADAMNWWGLYLGKNMAPSTYGGDIDFNKGLAFASLPTMKNARAHDARADCYSTYDVLRIMASGSTPNLSDLKAKEREAWINSQ